MKTTIKAKTAEDFLGLEPEHFKIFKDGCNRVYQTVGHEFGDQPIRRNDLVEIVLDGGFFETYSRPPNMQPKEWYAFYNQTLSPWISKNFGTPKFKKLMKQVFPFERYDP